MSGSDSSDIRTDATIDVPVDGTLLFDESLQCQQIDAGAAAVLGVDPSNIDGEDLLSRLSRSTNTTRESLHTVVETGRPATIEWEANATGPAGWGWAVPDDGGVSVLLVVDDRERVPEERAVVDVGEHATDTARDIDDASSPADSVEKPAETLLAHTEALAGTGGWEYDIDSDTLTWTAGTRRVHGVEPDFDPTLERALSFYHPTDREMIHDLVEEAVESGESYDAKARIDTPDDRRRWIRTIGEPVERDGEVVAVRGAIQDVTESHEQQRQIALLRRAIDAAPVGVTLTDMRQDEEPLVYVNEAFEELTGYREQESIGRNCRFLHGADTDPETIAKLQSAMEAEESVTVTIRHYRADGTEFWDRLTIAPVVDADGTVTHYVGFQVDVTERKETESKLREFKRAVEHSGHAIYITDIDGTITYVNKSFEELTGYDSEEAVGETPRLVKSGKMGDQYYQDLWATISDGESFEERIIDKDSDGHLYRAHQTIAPLTDDDSKVTGFVAVQTDITDRIERSQQIAVLDRVLRHNLRNDMNVVLGHAQRLQDELEGDLASAAATIVSSSRDLLDLADKERAVVKHLSASNEIRTHELQPLLESVAADVSDRHSPVDIAFECPGELAVNATQQLPDAVGEFVENAVEHADDPHPEVEITAGGAPTTAEVPTGTEHADVRSGDGAVDMTRISIADRGPGIPESVRTLVASDDVPDSLTHTDGVGLWLASWIVARSGGSVEFEERDGGGTIVHIDLPRTKEPQ